MTTQRICLWSSPRNVSTALMYSFAQRPDTVVFDEPLYAHYLRVSGAVHPGKEDIINAQENDGNKVMKRIVEDDFDKLVVFYKQMTHHLIYLSFDYLLPLSNIIFIRDPKQIISSYAQVIGDVKMEDIGIEKQWQLFQFLHKNKRDFVVLDSGELIKNPSKVLKDMCHALNIPFYKEMLSWQAGAKPYDGIWAKYWYANVHKSTGFEAQQSSRRELPDYLQPLYEDCKQYYNLLLQHSIKAE